MNSAKSQSFSKATSFDAALVRSKIMGPNPLKLCEELLHDASIPRGACVCDLGSGTGITSALLAREYGFDTYAVDLWSDPVETAHSSIRSASRATRFIPFRRTSHRAYHLSAAFLMRS